MLRVGLTGGLGSGKSTAAKLFAALGAHVLLADEIARELMEPGERVHAAIAAHFGPGVVLSDGRLDRAALARIAFVGGRVEELNDIVHPATISRQEELTAEIFARDRGAVVIVESALIFETNYGESNFREATYGESNVGAPRQSEFAHRSGAARWRSRFDRLILVTAPEEVKIARFVARSLGDAERTQERQAQLEEEACRRLAKQIPDEQKSAMCDYVLTNGGPLTELEWQVDQLWPILQTAAAT